MTHSIIFGIRTKDFDKIEEIKDSFEMSEEFKELYQLIQSKYTKGNYQQKGGSQPFIDFPNKDDKEEDGYYEICIETGSHVSPCDELYALHWYYFVLAFRKYLKEDLNDVSVGYRLDGDLDLHGDEWMKKEIGIK